MIRKGDHITQVGRMRFEVTLQSQVKVADGMGGSTVTWSDTAVVRCDIQPLSMSERLDASRLMNDATHRITMRYRVLAGTTQRLKMGARIFNIVSVVNPENMNSHVVVIVKEDV